MKILFVSSVGSPFNPTQGSQQRSNLLLKACTAVADVDVISFCEDEISDSYGTNVLYCRNSCEPDVSRLTKWEKIPRLLFSLFPSGIVAVNREKEKVIDSFVGRTEYDFIVVRYALAAVRCGLYKYGKKLVVDADDDPSKVIRCFGDSYPTKGGRLFYRLYAANVGFAMRRFGCRIHGLFYSNIDNVCGCNAELLPNVPFYDLPDLTERNEEVAGRLIFVGDMGYSPNADAVESFLKTVYSDMLKSRPGITFHIVGKCTAALKTKWESFPGVTVTGFVPSLEAEYAQAQIAVLPMKFGAGTCIKFLEAVQMGCPVVATPQGFSGYEKYFEKGEDCLVADNREGLRDGIVRLLDDDSLRSSIRESARRKLGVHFSKARFYGVVSECLLK